MNSSADSDSASTPDKKMKEGTPRRRARRGPSLVTLTMLAWFVVVIVVGMLVSTKYGTMIILLSKDYPSISTAALARQQQQQKQRRDEESAASFSALPPLESLVNSQNYSLVEGADVSWLLDFAIIGFAKCGTTSLLRTLGRSSPSYLYMLPRERCDLTANRPDQVVQYLYKEGPPPEFTVKNKTLHKGLKCPQDVESESSLQQYATTFSHSHLLVSLRHPVDWFESLYNFKHSTTDPKKLPATSGMLKGCFKGHKGVCAWRGNFHDYLARMGKTPMTSSEERNLLEWKGKLKPLEPPMANPLFLCHVEQMGGSTGRFAVSFEELERRGQAFRRDLSHFLQLPQEIPALLHVSPQLAGGTMYKSTNNSSTEADATTAKKPGAIDICEPQHAQVRAVLIRQGKKAATWIQDYLLKHPTVTASDPETFALILQTWSVDPCVATTGEDDTREIPISNQEIVKPDKE